MSVIVTICNLGNLLCNLFKFHLKKLCEFLHTAFLSIDKNSIPMHLWESLFPLYGP